MDFNGNRYIIKNKKRGRPTGRNRVPLSLEQRRARNALYERERRQAAAEAMSVLAEATGCEPSSSHADILATALNLLQRAAKLVPTDDIKELRRLHKKLFSQVDTLEQRVANWEKPQNNEEVPGNSAHISVRKRKNSDTTNNKENKKPKI